MNGIKLKFVILGFGLIPLLSIAAGAQPEAREPHGARSELLKTRPIAPGEVPPRIGEAINFFDKHFKGKVQAPTMWAMIRKLKTEFVKASQKAGAKGEAGPSLRELESLQGAENNFLAQLKGLGISEQDLNDPAKMQQVLQMFCLDQVNGLNQDLSQYNQSKFPQTGAPAFPDPTAIPHSIGSEAPAPGAQLWWKFLNRFSLYAENDLTSPAAAPSSPPSFSDLTSPTTGFSAPPPSQQDPNNPFLPDEDFENPCPDEIPDFPPNNDQPQPNEPEESDSGGGGTPGGGSGGGAPSGGGGAPGGGKGGSLQPGQIPPPGPLAALMAAQAIADVVVPFGVPVPKAATSLLPPDFQAWAERINAEILASVRPLIFPKYVSSSKRRMPAASPLSGQSRSRRKLGSIGN